MNMDSDDDEYEVLQQHRAGHPRRRTRLSLTTISANPSIIAIEDATTSGINDNSSPDLDSPSLFLSENESIDGDQASNSSPRTRRNARTRLRRSSRRRLINNPVEINNRIDGFRIRTSIAAERALNSSNNAFNSRSSAGHTSVRIEEILRMINEIRRLSESEGTALSLRAIVVQVLNHFFDGAYRHLNASNNYGLSNSSSDDENVNGSSDPVLNPALQNILAQDNELPMNELSSRLNEFAQIAIRNEASRSLNINSTEARERQSSSVTNESLGRNNENSSLFLNNAEQIKTIIGTITSRILPTVQAGGPSLHQRQLIQLSLLRQCLNTQLHSLRPNSQQEETLQSAVIQNSNVNVNLNLNLPSTSTGRFETRNFTEVIEIEDEPELPTGRSPGSSKKRKRHKTNTPKKDTKPSFSNLNEDEDDGSTCPICLDHWDLSGSHRLSSLKCGHLFGDSCIRRWLNECAPNAKLCPSCKSKVGPRDLRFIYAKRIRTVDNSEEIRLREQVEEEKNKYTRLQTDYELLSFELKTVKAQVTKLEEDIERMSRIQNCTLVQNTPGADKAKLYQFDYKMFLSKNITICQEPGCRVLIHSKQNNNLIISQTSSQSLFNGFGVKFIDVQDNFRPTNFLYTSQRAIRDLSLNANDELISCASMETTVKIFDLRTRQSAVSLALPTNQTIWACAFDKEYRSNTIYLGSQHGSTYIYDIRNRSQIIDEQFVEGDLSPVIQIVPVPISNMFPHGGFWVCKLQSLWFYEILSTQALNATRIGIEGPFMSINYDAVSGNMLVSTRNCTKFPMSKYILGKIMKVNDTIVWDTEMHLFGSKVTPVMTRCTQISLPDNNSLIAAYIQDAKQLTLWNVGECSKIQSLPCSDTVYDTCPIKIFDKIYMAASTDMKCRIYEIVSSEKC